MTEREKKQLLARVDKLRPKPRQMPSGTWICEKMVDGKRVSATDEDPEIAHAKVIAMAAGILEKKKSYKKVTLDEAIQRYIAAGEGVLSPSTIRSYETIRKNRFPELMKENVYSLDRLTVQAAVSNAAKSLAPKTVASSYGLLTAVLKDYRVDISGVKLPQKKKQKKSYLSADEIVKMIDAASGDSCELPILMAVWLGMRRSEISGLCWDCVDFEKKTIEVKRSYVPGKDHKFVLRDETKNEGSQRIISCPDYIMSKLESVPRGPGGRVFSISPETIRRHVHECCERAGITDTTVHGLRHANAAVMITLNVVDKYAMARNGWTSDYTFKQIYGYVFPEDANKTDEQINEYFEKAIETAKSKSK